MDRADGRQIDRHDEIGRGVVVEAALAHSNRLAALQDEVDHRLVDRRQFVFGNGAPDHGDARNPGFRPPVLGARCQSSQFLQLFFHGRRSCRDSF
ncbi:hypothetical protein D3C72_1903730 [compost metagenome]